jgi:hypothetical protein
VTAKQRVVHYTSGTAVSATGQRVARCSTPETRITRPLVANRAYVTCPRCNELLGRVAATPRTAKAKVAGLPATDSAAMREAKIALGVKSRPAPNPDRKKPPKPQIAGQRDIFDALRDDSGNNERKTG